MWSSWPVLVHVTGAGFAACAWTCRGLWWPLGGLPPLSVRRYGREFALRSPWLLDGSVLASLVFPSRGCSIIPVTFYLFVYLFIYFFVLHFLILFYFFCSLLLHLIYLNYVIGKHFVFSFLFCTIFITLSAMPFFLFETNYKIICIPEIDLVINY